MANILYVDGNAVLFHKQFGKENNIISVASMAEALEKLATTKFDLVVADYDLHQKRATGADLADRLLDDTPMILLVTGDASKKVEEGFIGKHSAIKVIVHKPPDIAELGSKMKDVIDKCRAKDLIDKTFANEKRRVIEINEVADKDIKLLQERISRLEIPEGVNTRRMVELIRTASSGVVLETSPDGEVLDNKKNRKKLAAKANLEILANKVAEIVKKNPGLQAAIEHFFEGNVLCKGIKEHSLETYEHINNSTKLLAQIVATELMPPNNTDAGEYRMDAKKGAALCIGVILHDYGKIYVPDKILHYPGRLDGANKEIMDNHVTYSIKMIKALGLPTSLRGTTSLIDIVKIIATHHENLNGSGYPKGPEAKGWKHMPYITHILPIIDRFKAMTSVRSYRLNPKTCEEAEKILNKEAREGKISGKLLNLFLDHMYEFRGQKRIVEKKAEDYLAWKHRIATETALGTAI